MEYGVDAFKGGGDVVRAQVKLVEGETGVGAQGGEVGFFYGAWVVGDEGIEAHDLMPRREQGFAKM